MMKRILLTFIATIVFLVASADYLQEGMIWQNDANAYNDWNGHLSDPTEPLFMSLVYIQGDTVVGGETYHKLYLRMFSQNDVKLTGGCSPRLYSLLREDNGRIYQIQNPGDTEAKLIFDFSLPVGSETEVCVEPKDLLTVKAGDHSICRIIVVEEFEIEMCGQKYTCKWVGVCYDEDPLYYYIWVEGIGYPKGIMFNTDIIYGGGNYPCNIYAPDGTLIYTTRDLPEFPEWPSGIEAVGVDKSADKAYDINGHNWKSGSKGIQIKNGKKSLIK